MNDLPLIRRMLAAAISLCFVSGIAVAVARMGDSDGGARVDVNASAGAGAGHDRAADDADGDDHSDGHEHTHGAAATEAQTVPTTALSPAVPIEQSAGLGAPGDPGPVTPPKEGTYRYRTTLNGHAVDQPMVVEGIGRTGDAIRQAVVMQTGSSKVRNDITWSREKAVLSKTVFDFGRSTGDCDWAPDITQRPAALKVGTTWQSDSTCTVYFNGVPIKMAQRASAAVKGSERLRVAGEVVDVWIIEENRHADFNGRASDAVEKTWFSPKHGVVVKGITNTSTKNGNETSMLETISELQNLKPE